MSVLVLYGSETGNSADMASLLYEQVRRSRVQAACKPFGAACLADLVSAKAILIVCSTTGQGALPQNCSPLWQSLLKRQLSPSLLHGVGISIFALGDSAYPRFNWAGKKIEKRLAQLGAHLLIARGEGDEAAPSGSEGVPATAFAHWSNLAVHAAASAVYEGEAPYFIPNDELLSPVFKCDWLTTSSEPRELAQGLHYTEVLSNKRMTDPNHFQDTRFLQLKPLPNWTEDSLLCIYPENHISQVDSVLESQGCLGDSERLLDLDPNWVALQPNFSSPVTLRTLLTKYLDLNSVPRSSFFRVAAHFCEGREAEKMREFGSGIEEFTEDLYDYANRPRRSLAETICEFSTLRIPIDYLLDLLPPLRPRKFSIASSVNSESIDLAVALVKYKTVLRRIRHGVCSRYVSALNPGDKILCQLEPANTKAAEKIMAAGAAILIATGTGIAPIRAILNTVPRGIRILLFYGCRSSTSDYYFGTEFEDRAKADPSFSLHNAFSRENGGYVQQLLTRHRESVQAMPSNAIIYVCGSSGAMPLAVRDSLSDILGKDIVGAKEKQGTYIQETW